MDQEIWSYLHPGDTHNSTKGCVANDPFALVRHPMNLGVLFAGAGGTFALPDLDFRVCAAPFSSVGESRLAGRAGFSRRIWPTVGGLPTTSAAMVAAFWATKLNCVGE
jgi:hypothetical protein